MKGFKAFDQDLKCRGHQYEVGKTYRHEGGISMCSEGFHFCERLADCYGYYPESSRVCEVVSGDNVIKGDDKCVTDEITIVRELSREEVLTARNTGKDCTGIGNTGDLNTGHLNTGDLNTGNWNTGNWNTGNWNTGYRNTGDWNTGDWNTGNWNTGNWNTGYRNTGDRNTGDWNTGYYNTGDWNTTDFSSGVLCTEEPECLIFDQPSGMTLREWRSTEACRLMSRLELKTTEWRCEDDMSDQEKADHPEHELAGGYLKKHADTRYNFAEWWERLTAVEKNIINAIPNFDAAKWEKITGVRL